MRLRHRHLNAASYGGDILLDARYLDLSNNSAVSSWSNRANVNNPAAQANVSNQPTYQTNQLNGNAGVSFDGTDDFLSWSGVNVRFTLVVYERTGSQTQYGSLWGSTGIEHIFDNDNKWASGSFGGNRWSESTWTSNGSSLTPTASQSISATASIITVLLNNLTTNTISQTRERTFSTRVPFARIYQYFTSQTNFANSVAKRLRHAAAFSFKISCN
jgi:hypothetical protein